MKWLGSLGIPIMTAAASAAFLVAHVAVGRSPSDTTQQLVSTGLALAIVLWMIADARMRRRTPCYDFGFLVAVYFPVSLVWYVFWSRGWKGLLILAAFVGLWLVPWFSALGVWVLRYGLG
jgi:hypothetical protein